jgi:hypothetical protein
LNPKLATADRVRHRRLGILLSARDRGQHDPSVQRRLTQNAQGRVVVRAAVEDTGLKLGHTGLDTVLSGLAGGREQGVVVPPDEVVNAARLECRAAVTMLSQPFHISGGLA